MPDCVLHNGTSTCYIGNNTVQQCMPGTYEQGAKQLGSLTFCTLPTAWNHPCKNMWRRISVVQCEAYVVLAASTVYRWILAECLL